jgi:hypothetical protein
LHERLDIGEAVAIELQVAQQRRMAEPHEEIGVQVEAVAGQHRFLRGAAAADLRVAFEHRDVQAGARQIGGKRQPVVAGADDDPVVRPHGRLPRAR